jgi:hypothetical protein
MVRAFSDKAYKFTTIGEISDSGKMQRLCEHARRDERPTAGLVGFIRVSYALMSLGGERMRGEFIRSRRGCRHVQIVWRREEEMLFGRGTCSDSLYHRTYRATIFILAESENQSNISSQLGDT